MKHIILSLIFLSSMPVAGLSAAASAAVDVKTKVANVSANATANPTATVGNSASAAAAPESEAKGKASEADVKLSSLARQVEAACRAIHSKIVSKAASAPLAGPSWQTIDVSLRSAFDQHGTFVPRDVTNIMLDYAQSDLRPARDILADITSDAFQAEMLREGEPLRARFMQHKDLLLQQAEAMCDFLRTAEGVIFAYGPEIADRWKAAGFQFDPRPDTVIDERPCVLVCHECNDPGSCFGSIAVCLDWRNPLDYHRFGCKVRRGVRKAATAFKRKLKQPQGVVPIERTESKRFANYVMNKVDLYARHLVGSDRRSVDAKKALANFMAYLGVVQTGMTQVQGMIQFAENPQAWIEAENKRAAELGSPVRYKLPEKPATK